jgi:hypothetical protein
MIIIHLPETKKTKPNKAKIERDKLNFIYNPEDCRGPSGLAMTDCDAFA